MAISGECGESSADRMLQYLRSFLLASDWDESKGILERHPELMNDAGYSMIDIMAGDADAARAVFPALEEGEALRKLARHRTVLARCGDVGIDRAFAELGVGEKLRHKNKIKNTSLTCVSIGSLASLILCITESSAFDSVFFGVAFLTQVGILFYLYVRWDEMSARSRWGTTAAGTLMGVLAFAGILILIAIAVVGIFVSLFG